VGSRAPRKPERPAELHRKAAEADEVAARYRLERDRLILQLRAEDPARWSYASLAAALGCSRELVALVSRRARWAEPWMPPKSRSQPRVACHNVP